MRDAEDAKVVSLRLGGFEPSHPKVERAPFITGAEKASKIPRLRLPHQEI